MTSLCKKQYRPVLNNEGWSILSISYLDRIQRVDFDDLKILNLNDPKYNILNWLAILTRYRSYWQNGSIAEPAYAATYYEKKVTRDKEARRAYRETKTSPDNIKDIFILDIMREGMKNDDPRLR